MTHGQKTAAKVLRTAWPRVRVQVENGVETYCVDARPHGKREYYGCHRKSKAWVLSRADAIEHDTMRLGYAVGQLQVDVKVDALRASELLKPYGKTIMDAARDYVRRLEFGNMGVRHAVEKWLESKGRRGLADRSVTAIEYRIKFLLDGLGERRLSELSHERVERWFDEIERPASTKAGIKAVCSEFFGWCVKNEWIEKNPCDYLEVKRTFARVEILTVEECGKILEAAVSGRLVPYVLVSLFCGLRPSEAQGMTWDGVDLARRELRVLSGKVHQERYIPLSEELGARLVAVKDKPFAGENFRKRWDAVKLLAGFGAGRRFPDNGMRHSFASYWLAVHADRPRLAEIMGNSPEVIRLYYRRAIPREEGERFWGLLR